MDSDQHLESSYGGTAAVSSIFPHLFSSSWSTLDAMEAQWGGQKGFPENAELKKHNMINPLENPSSSLWPEDKGVGKTEGGREMGQS